MFQSGLRSAQNIIQQVVYLRIGQNGEAEPMLPGHGQLSPNGGCIVKEEEVGAAPAAGIGEVLSAQLGGEKDVGREPGPQLCQLTAAQFSAAPASSSRWDRVPPDSALESRTRAEGTFSPKASGT